MFQKTKTVILQSNMIFIQMIMKDLPAFSDFILEGSWIFQYLDVSGYHFDEGIIDILILIYSIKELC